VSQNGQLRLSGVHAHDRGGNVCRNSGRHPPGLASGWRRLPPARLATELIQAESQSLPQVVEGFQSEGERLSRGFEARPGQPSWQELPQERGRNGMPRQDLGQVDRQGVPATAPAAAVGTEDPLAAGPLTIVVLAVGSVAVENAVPV
jgi:hypothetical protein